MDFLNKKVVKILSNGYQGPGEVVFQWDSSNELGMKVSSGAYLCTIQIEDFFETKKIVLMK